MPAIWIPSGRPVTPFVVPTGPDDGTTFGRTCFGTPISSHSSSLHASFAMSNTSVRDAFVTSVAWTAPPVRRHSRYASPVANAISPALPHDRVVDGLAGLAIPQDRGLALARDADRRDRLRIDSFQRLAERVEDRAPDVFRIVLDPAGLRIDLTKLLK